MIKFLTSNDKKYRLARTIVQGVIGVVIAYLDVIVGLLVIPNELRPMIVALVMAILSPIMAELGVSINDKDQPVQYTFNCDSYEEMMGVHDDKKDNPAE